jgi:rSAM/selenodomain-associated transferase 1
VAFPHVIVFLRAPELGKVKTRLAATVGPAVALTIYERLLALTFAALRQVPEVTLRVTPDTAIPAVTRWRQPGWNLAPQGEGDLGTRLARAVADSGVSAARPVVVIGCDCPQLAVTDLVEAAWELEEKDVVLGPATDGGYWLIGLRRPAPELFRGISWGTDRVLTESLAAAATAGFSVGRLRELRDVDTEADWQAWLASVR